MGIISLHLPTNMSDGHKNLGPPKAYNLMTFPKIRLKNVVFFHRIGSITGASKKQQNFEQYEVFTRHWTVQKFQNVGCTVVMV